MPMENKNPTHRIEMLDCARLTLTGVKEVKGFDEENVSLSTTCGAMTVEGEGLHITLLDLEHGNVTVEGHLSALYYTKERVGGGGLFGRWKNK